MIKADSPGTQRASIALDAMKLLSLALFASAVGGCLGARILGLLAMPSRSHGNVMERLLRELGNRGHVITYVTAQPPRQGPIPNMTVIHIPDVEEAMFKGMPKSEGEDKPNMFQFMQNMNVMFMFLFSLAGAGMCEHVLNKPDVQKLINSDQEFDLILAEAFLDESLMAGFAYKYNAPIVAVMSFMPNIWGNYLVGNPAPSSYIPEPTLGLSSKMTFIERMQNFLFNLCWDIFHPLIYLNMHDNVMKKYFGDDAPKIHDILLNTSVVLVNHHHSLGFPRAYLPNMIEVAGMHINPVKPLPADLKKYLDDSKNGAILFSMGSNLKSADLTVEQRTSIIKAFEKLPYNVLWKFEEELTGLPKNIKISSWLPQSDILAHPNLKLFITHGGLLSTTEAVHRGVPVLGIPVFGDQPLNMKHTENAGLGKTFKLADLTNPTAFYDAIMEITTDNRFAQAAKLKSSVFQDDMNTPIEKSVWWVEYVIKYKGAAHLRSSAQDLPYYQLHLLDVVAVLIVGSLVAAYVSLIVLRSICRLLCSKKSSPVKSSAKKNVKKNN